MNEITKVHLGRQAFTIAIDAHTELRAYLSAIKHQINDPEVVDEVELRMAELLAEHGIAGDKVILTKDVDFLKGQLGDPADFTETSQPLAEPETVEGRRLFRDPDDALLAGVAAGLAKYFGIDVLLIRLLFLVGIFTGGVGILLYIALWLLVPEAKTSSERLQMAGKPVTIDSLRQVVDRADLKGAARRANNSLAGPINNIFKIVLKIVGLGFIITGLMALLGIVTSGTYLLINGGKSLNTVFPVGPEEHGLLAIALAVAGLIALFVILFGIAIFRRAWPIKAWVTGTLIGLLLIGCAVAGALAADTIPHVHDRYDANMHLTIRQLPAFSKVTIEGSEVGIAYVPASTYSVSLKYYDHPNLSAIKTSVSNGTLTVDTRQFDWHRHCSALCLPRTYNMLITIAAPNINQIAGAQDQPALPPAVNVPELLQTN